MRTYRTLAAAAAAASLAVVAAGCSGDQPAAAPTPTVTVTVTVTPTPEMNAELAAAACKRYRKVADEVDDMLEQAPDLMPAAIEIGFRSMVEDIDAAADSAPEPLATQMREAASGLKLLGEAIVTFKEGDTIDEEYLAWSSTNRTVLATCGS